MITQEEALKKLQTTELKILVAIADFCKANNIVWYIDSGTALGAMRHKGFIPWDDDIDIAMPRKDYDRFLELANDGFANCRVHTARNTKGYAPLFAKVCLNGTRFETQETRDAGFNQGIFVDAFPIDRLSKDENVAKQQMSKAIRTQREAYLYNSKSISVPGKGLIGSIQRFGCVVLHYIERVINHNPQHYQDVYDSLVVDEADWSDNCALLGWPVIYKESDLFPTADIEFEGHAFPGPANMESYLTKSYGDWRVLPPPESRHTHLPLLLDFGDETIWTKDTSEFGA